jgi:hypothetical protein
MWPLGLLFIYICIVIVRASQIKQQRVWSEHGWVPVACYKMVAHSDSGVSNEAFFRLSGAHELLIRDSSDSNPASIY